MVDEVLPPAGDVVRSTAEAGAHGWRGTLTVVLVAAAVTAFVWLNRRDVPDAWRAARHASPGWLVLGLVACVAYVAVYGMARRAALAAFGVVLGPRAAVRAALVAHSLNIVTKSGGLAGLAVYREEARRRGAPASRVLGGYVLAVVLGDIAFACTLAGALLLLVADGRFTTSDAFATALVVVYFATITTVVVAAARSRDAIRRLHAIPARLRRRPPDHAPADELFDAVAEVRRRPRSVLPAFAWLVGIEALGVAMLWCALAAFGVRTGLTTPLVGYAISVLFSMVGVLPAGIGFAEASLGAVLVSFDVAGPTATVVVLTSRVLETWIPLGLGLVVARGWRRSGGVAR